MLAFAAALAMAIVAASALAAQHGKAAGMEDDVGRAAAAEGAARAVEESMNGGGAEFDFYREGVYYRIEDGRFHMEHKGRVVEVEGVFAYDSDEPA